MERNMRHGISALLMLLAAQTVALAQGSAPMLGAPVEPVQFTVETVPLRGWASAEYLNWWIRGQPAPGPLVTTGDPASPTAGFLSDGSTQVLFGDSSIRYGAFTGGRFTIGTWLDAESITGIEFTGFFLRPRETRFHAASDATGTPILAMPTTLPDGGEGVLFTSSNGLQVGNFQGNITVTTSSRLLGGELNGVFNAWRMENDVLEIIAGLRYLDLQEDLQTRADSSGVGFDDRLIGNDSFNTRNHFYGAQIGARWTGGTGRLSTSVAGIIGLGATHQVVGIDGTTVHSGTAINFPGTTPGFLYTQRTNIGRRQQTDFSAVPHVQVKFGYNLLTNLRLTFGYDFLCWTNVVRPSEQIDRVVNNSQGSPDIFPNGAFRLIGAARPAPLSNRSDFWTQGVSGGVEFSW